MIIRAAFALLFLALPGVSPAELKYSRNVAEWTEITPPPPGAPPQDQAKWIKAATVSGIQWLVETRAGRPSASMDVTMEGKAQAKPRFPTLDEQGNEGTSFAEVDDGWLVGFREPASGGLHWFSRNGRQKYKISDHGVVDFFTLPNGPHAIESVGHPASARGSVIRLARAGTGGKWEATEAVKLASHPHAVSVGKDGAALITLQDSLVSMSPDYQVRTLAADAPWKAGLYPNSSALTQDGGRLYIGMAQYVGEYDLKTGKLRLLLPSADFMDKVAKDNKPKPARRPPGGRRPPGPPTGDIRGAATEGNAP